MEKIRNKKQKYEPIPNSEVKENENNTPKQIQNSLFQLTGSQKVYLCL